MSGENIVCSVPKFNQQYSLHLPCVKKGKQVDAEDWKNSCYQITKKDSNEIGDAQEFWRILRSIPSFNESPLNCQYMWFKKGYEPNWEANPDDYVLSFKYEEDSNITGDKDKWTGYKCVIEARVFFLLFTWMGNSIPVLTKQVNGICVKIQTTRIVLDFWVSSNSKHSDEEEINKPLSEDEENISLDRLKNVIKVLLDVGDNTAIVINVDNNREKSQQCSRRSSSKSRTHSRTQQRDKESKDRNSNRNNKDKNSSSTNRERTHKSSHSSTFSSSKDHRDGKDHKDRDRKEGSREHHKHSSTARVTKE